jgi:hypothetical protein
MPFPAGWTNPIMVLAGQVQRGVDPVQLLPARTDLLHWRLDQQIALLDSAVARYTPIQVTAEGVIWDGHHGVRAAAEKGLAVDVPVVGELVEPSGMTILNLPVG